MVVNPEYLLITQISKLAGISASTCRRYIDAFPQFFHVKRVDGRTTKYRRDAVEIVKRISSLYSDHATTEEIMEQLSLETPAVIDIEGSHHLTTTTPAYEIIMKMSGAMTSMQEQFSAEIRELRQELSERDRRQEEWQEEHDRRFAEGLRKIQERLEEKKKPWWVRTIERFRP